MHAPNRTVDDSILSSLQEIRTYIASDAFSTKDLTMKLDKLEDLVKEDRTRQQRRLLKRRSEPALKLRRRVEQTSRQLPNFSLPRTPQSKLHVTEELSEAESTHSSLEDDEEISDSEDSFARLSTLLEQSILEGQHALDTILPSALGPVLDIASEVEQCPAETNYTHELAHQDLPARHEKFEGRVAASDRCSGEVFSNRSAAAADTRGKGLIHSDPPTYEQVLDDPRPVPQGPVTLIDDGISALESLIDQMTNTTLLRKEETGLTSSNFVLVMSVAVLIVSYLISQHGAPFGVNCHCICPN